MDIVALTLRDLTADLTAPQSKQTSQPRSLSGAWNGSRTTLRRCRTREQGIALMTVGHAIEYLFDSRLVQQQTTTSAEREALAILLNANLAVYNEGTEVVPLKARLRRWLHGSPLKTRAATAQ